MSSSYKRTAFPCFELKNSAYVDASVTFYEVDTSTGARTDTLANIYSAYSGGVALANPYTLDGDGKAKDSIYFDAPVIAVLNTAAIGEHSTGIYFPVSGQYRGAWVANSHYLVGDIVLDGIYGDNTGSIYVCAVDHTSATWPNEISNGYLELVIDATRYTDAAASADNAAMSADAAAASAVLADASADSAAQTLSEVSLAAHKYLWSAVISETDPTSGYVRINNASFASATKLMISETNANAQNISGDISSWDDSTSPSRGRLKLFSIANPSNFVIYRITGSNTDNGTWQSINVTFLTNNGAFVADDALGIVFTPTGDQGTASLTDGDYGDITISSGGAVLSVDAEAITLGKIQKIAAKRILANSNSVSDATPQEKTMSQILDFLGTVAQGSIIYRSSSSWVLLSPGTQNQALITKGASNDPEWGSPATPYFDKTTSFTPALVEANSEYNASSASAIVVTVPTTASVAFPIGTVLIVTRMGTGTVTFAAASGVTILKDAAAGLAITAQYKSAVLTKKETNSWLLEGSI
jgi:hypothetical protein